MLEDEKKKVDKLLLKLVEGCPVVDYYYYYYYCYCYYCCVV